MLDDMEKLALRVSHLIDFFVICGLFIFMIYWTEAYLEPCQTSKIEPFAKIVNE